MITDNETWTCVNLAKVPDRPELPQGFGYCAICDGWHDIRWHQAVWRRASYEQNRVSIAVYRRVDAKPA